MAKKKTNKEEILSIPDVGATLESLFDTPIVVEVPGPTYTWVMPQKDFHCCIGKQWYYFTKGVKQKVPPSVAETVCKNPEKCKYVH